MLIGYAMFRNLALGSNIRIRKKEISKELGKYLLDPGEEHVVE